MALQHGRHKKYSIPHLALATAIFLVIFNLRHSTKVSDPNIHNQATNDELGDQPTIRKSSSRSTSTSWKVILAHLLHDPSEVASLTTGKDHRVTGQASIALATDATSIPDTKMTSFSWSYEQEFNVIDQNAFRITPKSFCLDWSIPSDRWWTHHPEWELSEETDSYYCFQRTSDSKKAAYMKQLYENQFAGNCTNQFSMRMKNSGWAADISNLKRYLNMALWIRRPVQINQSPWHYAAPDAAKKGNSVPSPPACSTMNLNCYFLEISNCPHLESFDASGPDSYPDLPRVAGTDASVWLSQYIVRPQLWLRKKVREFAKNQTIVKPCTALHVRRSDVILHGKTSRKYRAISEYINVSSRDPNFQVKRNVFLLTDDQNAIGEAKATFPDYNWMYLDRPRWKADEGGWERQLPSSQPIFEMVVLLSTFHLVQRCDSLVRTNSGFGLWLEFYMKISNTTTQTLNLDVGEKTVHSLEYQGSKSVSMQYILHS